MEYSFLTTLYDARKNTWKFHYSISRHPIPSRLFFSRSILQSKKSTHHFVSLHIFELFVFFFSLVQLVCVASRYLLLLPVKGGLDKVRGDDALALAIKKITNTEFPPKKILNLNFDSIFTLTCMGPRQTHSWPEFMRTRAVSSVTWGEKKCCLKYCSLEVFFFPSPH